MALSNKPVSELTPEEYKERREYYRQYNKKHFAKLKQEQKLNYQLKRKNVIRDITNQYKYDPDFKKAKRDYNAERQRQIRAGTWKPKRKYNRTSNEQNEPT